MILGTRGALEVAVIVAADTENGKDRFLGLLGQDPQLDLAFVDVEDDICGIPLSEDDLPLAQLGPGFSGPDPRQKDLGIER